MSERNYARRTKRVRRTLITIFGVFSALITNAPSIDAQTAPEVAVPTIVSTGSDQGDLHTRADTVLPSMRYHSQIDVSQTSVHFRGFDLAGDDEVYVYGPASDSIVCGPFTKKGPC
jgi:hypothetical protein